MNPLEFRLRDVKLGRRTESAMTRALVVHHQLRKLRIIMRPDFASMVYRRFISRSVARQRSEANPLVANGAFILAYHRVTRLKSDPQMLSVTPERFGEQLELLKQRFEVVPLQTLIRRLEAGKSVSRCVVITFDDGYADNLHIAKPLMERLEIPCTIFIATDHIGKAEGFWWDELDRIVLGDHAIPRNLRLDISGRHYRWDFEDSADFDPAEGNRYQSWNVDDPETPTRRHYIYHALHSVLHDLTPTHRESTLHKLRRWAGLEGGQLLTHRSLTHDELLELSESKLIEIGAHTATHPALSMLPIAQQEAEIRGGKERLESMIGRRTHNFAYPYGSLSSYDSRTLEIVRAVRFQSACTTFADIVRAGCNLHQLPRLLVRNWNGDEFERRLRAIAPREGT